MAIEFTKVGEDRVQVSRKWGSPPLVVTTAMATCVWMRSQSPRSQPAPVGFVALSYASDRVCVRTPARAEWIPNGHASGLLHLCVAPPAYARTTHAPWPMGKWNLFLCPP